MDTSTLKTIAYQLMQGNKGLLAMDESTATCNKRFRRTWHPSNRRIPPQIPRPDCRYAPGLEEYISGAILFDETIKQSTADGTLFIDILKHKGIVPGIKVDEGAIPMVGFPGEKITEGLDGLGNRLKAYYQMGARFAKWRAVITIGAEIPSPTCIKANAYTLARYAMFCQEAGLVPIVEPEVVMDGDHSLQRCAEVTTEVIHAVFNALYQHRVDLEGIILKPNMILPGEESRRAARISTKWPKQPLNAF
jgi:fructose-bisphosphate aldolase class I